MYNLDNILINKILGYLEPQKLVYNQPNTIISSYPHVTIIDIALVCKHWFELISKMLTHVGIHIKMIELDQTRKEYRVYVYPYNDRFRYDYSYDIDDDVYKSVDFYNLLNSRHALLNLNNIRSLHLHRIYPWYDEYDQLINRIIQNGQLKTFTVVSEIALLKFFIKKFKPTTFQYFVVPRITILDDLTHKDVRKYIKFLMKPKYNITWMETFISNINDYPCHFTDYEDMDSNDIAKYLQAVEKAAPISSIRMCLSGLEDNPNILNRHLMQINTLQLYYMDIMYVINIIKNCSQLKELYIKMFLPNNEIEGQLSELLKNNRSVEHLKIVNCVHHRTNSVIFSNHFSDLLTVNTTLTRLSLNSFYHNSEKFFQSLESNTTLRSLSITLFYSKEVEYLCHSVSLNKTLYNLKMTIYTPGICPVVSSEISVSIGKLLQSDTHNIKIIKLNHGYELDSKPIEDAINCVNSKSNNTKKIYLIVNHKLGQSLPKNLVNCEDTITIKIKK